MKKLLMAAVLLMTSTLALAHPGHGEHNLTTAFLHPLTGLDHMLVMLGIGLWASKLGGAARWQLPLTFLSVMAVGMALGSSTNIGWLESGIAASVMAMGLLLVLGSSFKPALQLGITAVFALMHGLAHGSELGSAQPELGAMLLATALLHAAGITLGARRFAFNRAFDVFAGWSMLAFGISLLTA